MSFPSGLRFIESSVDLRYASSMASGVTLDCPHSTESKHGRPHYCKIMTGICLPSLHIRRLYHGKFKDTSSHNPYSSRSANSNNQSLSLEDERGRTVPFHLPSSSRKADSCLEDRDAVKRNLPLLDASSSSLFTNFPLSATDSRRLK